MGLNSILIGEAYHIEYLIEIEGEWQSQCSNLETLVSDTMLNHHLSQKIKLIRRDSSNPSILICPIIASYTFF